VRHLTMLTIAPPHPATLDDEVLLAQCGVTRQRTGGPGGQHRNKVETAIFLTHLPTGIQAHADERRLASENRRTALRRLRLALAVGVRCDVPPGDQRSRLWRSRCSSTGRITCNPAHHDFPALLAEALDNLWSCSLDPRKAAARLCCTPSQLIRLLKDHPPAYQSLNTARRLRGMHVLR
jgi:hypothetical protein